jgi:hypothetical protein
MVELCLFFLPLAYKSVLEEMQYCISEILASSEVLALALFLRNNRE